MSDKSRHKSQAAAARSARGKTETAGLIKSGSSAPVGVIAARIKLNTPNTVPTAIPEARADAPPDSITASKTGMCMIVIDAFGPSGIMPRWSGGIPRTTTSAQSAPVNAIFLFRDTVFSIRCIIANYYVSDNERRNIK